MSHLLSRPATTNAVLVAFCAVSPATRQRADWLSEKQVIERVCVYGKVYVFENLVAVYARQTAFFPFSTVPYVYRILKPLATSGLVGKDSLIQKVEINCAFSVGSIAIWLF